MLYGSISHVLTFSQGMVLCPRVHLRKTVSHRQSRLRGEDAFGLAERWRQQELVRNTWIRDVVGVLIERTEAPSSPALDDAMDIDDKSLGENNRCLCPHGLLNMSQNLPPLPRPKQCKMVRTFMGCRVNSSLAWICVTKCRRVDTVYRQLTSDTRILESTFTRARPRASTPFPR